MRLMLAPMEGVVDFHLRKIFAAIGGIDLCVTEFIRVTQQVLPRHVFVKSCPELIEANRFIANSNDDNAKAIHTIPIRVQLLGSDPQLLALNAAKAASLGAIGIDMNFGCPAKAVNRNRGGACLLDETDLLAEIIHAVRSAVPEHVPVTAKIRLGYNDRHSYLDNAVAIAKAGASELVVHARSKADGYNPPAYWHYCADIKNEVDIPVIANGEIWTLEDFQRCAEQSQCEHFMLGRGLLANPFLALQIRELVEPDSAHLTSLPTQRDQAWAQIAGLLLSFFEETSRAYPARFMGNRVKQWLHYLRQHFDEAESLFEQIKRLREFSAIHSSIQASAQSPKVRKKS